MHKSSLHTRCLCYYALPLSIVCLLQPSLTHLLCCFLLQAHRDNTAITKELGWLSASEAEASALSRGLKAQVRDSCS